MQWKLHVACAALAFLCACAHQQPAPPSEASPTPPTVQPGGSSTAGNTSTASQPSPTPAPAAATSTSASATSAPVTSTPVTSANASVNAVKPSKAAAAPPTTAPATTSPPRTTTRPSSTPAAVASAAGRNASTQATLDLKSLEQRLRDTKAIGVFTKLSLKNQVDDLLADMKAFHGGQPQPPLSELRQSYESLLLKVVTVLQNGDPQLASAISSSRDAIWALLADPQKFAQIS